MDEKALNTNNGCSYKSTEETDDKIVMKNVHYAEQMETKSLDTRPRKTRSMGKRSVGTRSSAARSPEKRSSEIGPLETRPLETRSVKTRSSEMRSPNTRSSEIGSLETSSLKTKSVRTMSVETNLVETMSNETKELEQFEMSLVTKPDQTESPAKDTRLFDKPDQPRSAAKHTKSVTKPDQTSSPAKSTKSVTKSDQFGSPAKGTWLVTKPDQTGSPAKDTRLFDKPDQPMSPEKHTKSVTKPDQTGSPAKGTKLVTKSDQFGSPAKDTRLVTKPDQTGSPAKDTRSVTKPDPPGSPANISENSSSSSKDSSTLMIDISASDKESQKQVDLTESCDLNNNINSQNEIQECQDQSQDQIPNENQECTRDQSSSISVSFLSSDTTSAVQENSDKSTETFQDKILVNVVGSDTILNKTDEDGNVHTNCNGDDKQKCVAENQTSSNETEVSENAVINSLTVNENSSPEEPIPTGSEMEGKNEHLPILEGRDEDSLVAARLMTNLARGNLPFPQLGEKDLTELQVTSNNSVQNSPQVLLNVADPMEYSRHYGPLDFRSPINQSYPNYNGALSSSSVPSLPQGFPPPQPLDSIGPHVGAWNQSDLRRHSYDGVDTGMSLGQPQATSTPQESRSDSSLNWDANHISQTFSLPFPVDPNQIWNTFPGNIQDNRHLHSETNYEHLLNNLQSVNPRSNTQGLLFNALQNGLPAQGYIQDGPNKYPLTHSRPYMEQDILNYGPLDYRMMPNGPQFFPIQSEPGNLPVNVPVNLDYIPRYPHRDIGDIEHTLRPKHKLSCTPPYDFDLEQSPSKRRRRSRYSKKTASVAGGYHEFSRNLFFDPNDKSSKTAEILQATKNLQEQNDLFDKHERYFVIISPEVNPAEVKSIDHKGLLAKYIDYLIIENEQITEMSKSVSIPVDNFVVDDPYLSDIIKVKVPFPSAKYVHWLKTYYPNIQVDWKKIPNMHQYSGGDHRVGRTFYVDQRPLPLLLRESFFFFQSEKNKKESVSSV